jgi:hypothetical protein
MAIFQHPHLTRGVVKTTKGAFVISRGLVNAPDDIGESLGWTRVDAETGLPSDAVLSAARRESSTRRDGALLDRP